MMAIVISTGLVGLLASFLLLHAGVGSLWSRYPLAVAIAYVAFLFLLWCWLRLRRDDLLDDLDIPISGHLPEKPWKAGGGQFGGGGASGSFGEDPEAAQLPAEVSSGSPSETPSVPDAEGAHDLEELAVVLFPVAALVGAAWAVLWIVWVAPALLAELLLDTVLAAGLYRRLRGVKGDHWLRTAIRRTGWPFLAVAILFALAGAAMQVYAPGAKSIGQVIQHNNRVR